MARKFLLAAALLCAAAPAWPRAGGGGGGGGGCFPAGTRIQTLKGDKPIEKILPGDIVVAFSDEVLVQAEVEEIVSRTARLVKLRTTRGDIVTTAEHPFLTFEGFTRVQDLEKGDSLAMMKDGRRVWAVLRSIRTAGMSKVYNLKVSPPRTFIAEGFVVHNKGGGGGFRRSRSSGRRGGSGIEYVYFAAFAVMLVIKGLSPGSMSSGKREGAFLSRLETGPRDAATRDILQSLSRRDREFSPEALEALVRDIFGRAQAAWQARDYGPMRDITMPHLHAGHSAKLEAMKARGEVNMMEDVKVHGVQFVHVRRPEEEHAWAFTALISASARDYTIYEMSGSLISGSREERPFQEFWTFHRHNGAWALARIDQVGELDFLNAPNLPAGPLEAAALPAVPAGAAVPAAAAPEATAACQPREAGAGRGARWNRQKMEIAATLAFESVYSAWGRNDPALLSGDFVSAEALEKLRRIMRERAGEGLLFDFSKLAPRRAEVVLTTPAERSPLRLDEFTARINATAVRTMARNGRTLHRDPSPQPFTEYWVFGRQNDCWKLRDILPRMEQSGEDRTRDGAPSPVQIEWYWTA